MLSLLDVQMFKTCLGLLPMLWCPAMLIPSLIGARLYIGLSEATFRKIVLGLLTASGVALLRSALPHLLGRAS